MNNNSNSTPYISVIIPAHNCLSTLERCLGAVLSSDYSDYECILIDDSSTDNTPEKAREFGVQVISLANGPFGPAYARNRGVEAAHGQIVFFIDADVIIKADTLSKVAQTFEARPEVAALFGSYDEQPGSKEFLSQYKNLLHHYVHQIGREEASTFWSGCGAVRKIAFERVGGFDEKSYPKPSIEDIELGYRLTAAGLKIVLKKDIQVTHLKHWSLWGLIKTDIWYRAVPWTLLILKYRNLPNDLNLQTSQRLSTFFLLLLLVHQAIFSIHADTLILPVLIGLFLLIAHSWHWSDGVPSLEFTPQAEKTVFFMIAATGLLALILNIPFLLVPFVILLPLLLIGNMLSKSRHFINQFLFWSMIGLLALEIILLYASFPILITVPQLIMTSMIILLNLKLYLFFARKRGIIFAISALPLQLLYYFYSMVAFLIGGGIHFLKLAPEPGKMQNENG